MFFFPLVGRWESREIEGILTRWPNYKLQTNGQKKKRREKEKDQKKITSRALTQESQMFFTLLLTKINFLN